MRGETKTVTILVVVVFVCVLQIWKMSATLEGYGYSQRQASQQLRIGVVHTQIVDDSDDADVGLAQPTTATHFENEFANLEIRSWGCDLTETPLIFVHNGKSGGGNIRARLAAAALNYTRKKWQRPNHDNHYYPIQDPASNNSTARRGKFCNSQYPHYTEMPHIDSQLTIKTFEGRAKCNATTPLGIALACPHPYKRSNGNRVGGIHFKHYQNTNCGACDDDYYLQSEYYFPSGKGTLARKLAADTGVTNKLVKQPKNKRGRKQGKNKKARGGRNETLIDFIPPFSVNVLDAARDPPAGSTCDTVFVAHNNLGAELHWLPPRYLKYHWWDKFDVDATATKETLEPFWNKLLDDRHRRRTNLELLSKGEPPNEDDNDDNSQRWCPAGYTVGNNTNRVRYDRPSTVKEYERAYESCSRPLAQQADDAFAKAYPDTNRSPIYASMPLHRVTVLRDPWAWIISKFFWHGLDKAIPWEYPPNFDPNQPLEDPSWLPCFNVSALVPSKGSESIPADPLAPGRFLGWCEQYSLNFLIKLCGDDCLIRYENGMMNLSEIEAQVHSNLRQSFSVVGLLHQQDDFYDMVTDRIQYVDLSLHLNVSGGDHATPKTPANVACKQLFAHNETFRDLVRQEIPAFAALERMYHLGVKVNAFQKEELKQCKLAKGEEPTKGVYE